MPLHKIIEEINLHLTALLSMIAAIGALLAFRKKVVSFLVSIKNWFTRPKRIEEMLLEGKAEREVLSKHVKDISYAMFNDGANGVAQQVARLDTQVARLAACQTASFESAPFPAFECTSSGHTTRVNGAYRSLIESWSEKHIASSRWQQTLHGELVARYIAEFERCSKAKDDFIAVCDFKNPMTDEHRGRWRVHAPAAMAGDDCLYIGRFIAALDETAQRIAKEENWQVRIN